MLLEQYSSMLQTILLDILTPGCGLLQAQELFNTPAVDNQEHCCPNNIVASGFQQPVTTDIFFAVYVMTCGDKYRLSYERRGDISFIARETIAISYLSRVSAAKEGQNMIS